MQCFFYNFFTSMCFFKIPRLNHGCISAPQGSWFLLQSYASPMYQIHGDWGRHTSIARKSQQTALSEQTTAIPRIYIRRTSCKIVVRIFSLKNPCIYISRFNDKPQKANTHRSGSLLKNRICNLHQIGSEKSVLTCRPIYPLGNRASTFEWCFYESLAQAPRLGFSL